MTWNKIVAIAATVFAVVLFVWIILGVIYGYPADQPTTASPFTPAAPTAAGPAPGEAPETRVENTAVPAAPTVFGTTTVTTPQLIYGTPVPLGSPTPGS